MDRRQLSDDDGYEMSAFLGNIMTMVPIDFKAVFSLVCVLCLLVLVHSRLLFEFAKQIMGL